MDAQDISAEEILDFIHQNKESSNLTTNSTKDNSNSNIIQLDEESKINLGLVKKTDLPEEVRYNTYYSTETRFDNKEYDSFQRVELTDADKELFLRSILLDYNFVLPIKINDGNEICVRYLSDEYIEKVDSFCTTKGLSYKEFKKFLAYLMLDKFYTEDLTKDLTTDLDKLYEDSQEYFKQISDLKLDIIYKALNIFEVKMIKLFQAFDSEGF
jgi:hypothetical protein